ncbi:MAG: ABC transporter permease [Rhodothermales bacterium]
MNGFDLEIALTTWRRFHAQQRAFAKEDLDELERHLRDHTAHYVEAGLEPEAAFQRAMGELGDYGTGAKEYRKVHWAKLRRQGRFTHELHWRTSMLKSYLTVAWRSMRRHPGYTAINLTGLAVGLAASLFIGLWVVDELNHDHIYPDGERIHQVWRHIDLAGERYTWPTTTKPLADVLAADYSEVEALTQTTWPQQLTLTQGATSYREQGTYATAPFFEVFGRPFLQGDPSTALNDPQSIVLTERTARKLFGEGWATTSIIGQPLTLDRERDGVITGVIEDWPDNASFTYDVVLPFEEYASRNTWVESWRSYAFLIYLKLNEGVAADAFAESIAGVVEANVPNAGETLFLQPYQDVYLRSVYSGGQVVSARIEYVRLFGIVAVVLLLIAAINFMNLTTARSSQRAKEIGVRKAIGAERRALIGQFLGEALVLAFTAFVLALGLVVALLPVFNALTGKSVGLGDLGLGFMLTGLGVTVLLGVLAGSYPALYLSAFRPLAVLRGTLKVGKGSLTLRRGLVVTQFALSTLLIVATLAVYLQVDYIHSRDIGVARDNVVMMPKEGAWTQQYEAMRAELLAMPGVAEVTSANANPLRLGRSSRDITWEGGPEEVPRDFYRIIADYGFLETLRMDLLEGRSFDPQFADSSSIIVNEEMVRVMGIDDPLGRTVYLSGYPTTIVGVVRDFDMNSLYAPIEPVYIDLNTAYASRLFVRAHPGQRAEAIASLQAVSEAYNPGYPFRYEFLDDMYAEGYADETRLGSLASVFAFIAILVSCLGLLGLIAYTVAQRTKEVGVRKVLGATVPQLVLLLTKEVTVLVGAGVLIALPLAYLGVQAWIADFQHHADIGLGLFFGAGLLALGVAWLTVSYQSFKAATADPVDCLRYE